MLKLQSKPWINSHIKKLMRQVTYLFCGRTRHYEFFFNMGVT